MKSGVNLFVPGPSHLDRVRLARLVVIAVVVGIGLVNLIWAFTDASFNDLRAYQSAAIRLREGGQLYGGAVSPWTAYRYAPWFAYAFVPLSFIPWNVLIVLWTSFTLGCSYLALRPLVRDGRPEALLLVGLFGPLLIAISLSGNIQAPLVALLVMTMGSRWGPIAIGLAGSLKITPLLLCISYMSNRQWKRAGLAVAVSLCLWAPVLLFEVGRITFDSGGAAISPLAWFILAGSASAAALWIGHRHPRYGLLASAVAAYFATPRLYLYDTTILLAASPPTSDTNVVD
jgi:hypothetical protein